MPIKSSSPAIGGSGFYAEQFFKKFLGEHSLGLISMKNMYFGVELEVNLKSYKISRVQAAQLLHPYIKHFAIYTPDGSIPNGFEIKTAPCTYEYHLIEWKKFFDFIESEKNLLQSHGDNCGIHIHVSRDGFANEWHLGRFCYFIHRNGAGNRELMNKIAERFYNYRGIKNPSDYKRAHISRTAVHVGVGHCPTAEIRIFRSSVVREEFFKDLEFVHSLIRFTYPKVEANHAALLTAEKYLEYIKNHKEEYPNLWNFLNPNDKINPISVFEKHILEYKKTKTNKKSKSNKVLVASTGEIGD